MIIQCQNCSRKFQVNDEDIPKEGRMVQCSNCSQKWFHTPIKVKAPVKRKKKRVKKKIEEVRAQNIGLTPPTDLMPYIGKLRNIKPRTYKDFDAYTHHDSQFIGRVVFPVTDITGAIRAFIGRHMDRSQVPKY